MIRDVGIGTQAFIMRGVSGFGNILVAKASKGGTFFLSLLFPANNKKPKIQGKVGKGPRTQARNRGASPIIRIGAPEELPYEGLSKLCQILPPLAIWMRIWNLGII